jgi:glutaminase
LPLLITCGGNIFSDK